MTSIRDCQCGNQLPGLNSVKAPMKDPPKSNPSKRHRERLNGELDHLASLLPFEQSIISKLDKLSILRLSVSYLRTKSYCQAVLHDRYSIDHGHLSRSHLYQDPGFSEGDSLLQALNGFVFMVTCDGEVFFASRTVEQYLGFHQSDIIHQSVMELIHSEDREEFKTQLQWNSQLPHEKRDMPLTEILLPENSHYLHRSFTVRFRCLLDNTSGFITLEISGRIRMLHGQMLKGEEPPLALFGICCPFGPLPSLDSPMREFTFKTKHKMDLSPLSMDQRGKLLFGFSDKELTTKAGYDLLHYDDLSYYAAAHQELIKTGSSGLIAYRLQAKDGSWIWLQTSSKVIYKNSKPDFVICTHRHLTEDEGRDLLGKRGTEFKLPYPLLDSDTSSNFGQLSEDDSLIKMKTRSKKSKSQFRDYLHTGRKRKHPYRDVFNGINGYPGFSSLNGYSQACQNGDIKTDLMYPYTNTNFALETDLYHSYHPYTTAAMFPAASDTFRLETDKHSYPNGYSGYYLDSRQYQAPLQYGNGYSDLVGAATKYSYDLAKYNYDTVSNYGLDITKRTPLDNEYNKYDSDFKKYTDFSSDRLSHKGLTSASNPLDYKSTSVINTNSSLLGHNGFLNCSSQVPYGTNTSSSPCSLFHPTTTSSDRYSQSSHRSIIDTKSDPKHAVSVIQSPISRISSPHTKHSHHQNGISSPYSDQISHGSTWPSCSKTISQKTSPKPGSSLDNVPTADNGLCAYEPTSSKLICPPGKDPAVALSSMVALNNSSSPASATTAMSVIQHGRSCDKQSLSSGIAVPVVKSSSWMHHLPSSHPAYDWTPDSLSCHQRGLNNTPHSRLLKPGEARDDNANPLLSFSEVTHTLMNGD
ncbi:hypoxia-inducible factor 1-alpha-like isoform X2 [Lineus longissimus]|uniref:hypoxia-inducible factor 1-alpha-like isoform X2 n=1 Tax=Lineus longissimus TaxID=88925 RepID=UPI00315CDB12